MLLFSKLFNNLWFYPVFFLIEKVSYELFITSVHVDIPIFNLVYHFVLFIFIYSCLGSLLFLPHRFFSWDCFFCRALIKFMTCWLINFLKQFILKTDSLLSPLFVLKKNKQYTLVKQLQLTFETLCVCNKNEISLYFITQLVQTFKWWVNSKKNMQFHIRALRVNTVV